MGQDSKIEWTDNTFNPWWGCVKVSEACKHCYADTFANRLGLKLWGPKSERRFFGDKHWNEPVKWNRQAANAGKRVKVFCASMADVFEDREDLKPHRARLFRLICETPTLDWLLLTKRPENAAAMMVEAGLYASTDPDLPCPQPNIWVGTTCEDQANADKRIPELLKVPAAVRFLSCEPLLGPLNLSVCALDGDGPSRGTLNWIGQGAGIDWVICGGESGPKSRPMHPDWARSLRDQCAAVGVAFHFKQWGDWKPITTTKGIQDNPIAGGIHGYDVDSGFGFLRTGKAEAGRVLDGRTHDEFPTVRTA